MKDKHAINEQSIDRGKGAATSGNVPKGSKPTHGVGSSIPGPGSSIKR